MYPKSFDTVTARFRRVRIAATRGVAALVPTTAAQAPWLYSAMPPLPKSAAAEMSFVARIAHVPNFEVPYAVWYAGSANSVLPPLPVAPDWSFHTVSAYAGTAER